MTTRLVSPGKSTRRFSSNAKEQRLRKYKRERNRARAEKKRKSKPVRGIPHTPRSTPSNRKYTQSTSKQVKESQPQQKSLTKKPKKKTAKELRNEIQAKKQEELMETLADINHDIVDLMPQLEAEVAKVPSTGGKFKGVQSERQLWKRFLYAYARCTGNISKSCAYCGISRNHFYRAMERYPTLKLLVEALDERFVDLVEERMNQHALLPNSVVERIFILKNRRKGRYGEKQVAPVGAVQINFNNLNKMRDNSTGVEDASNGE